MSDFEEQPDSRAEYVNTRDSKAARLTTNKHTKYILTVDSILKKDKSSHLKESISESKKSHENKFNDICSFLSDFASIGIGEGIKDEIVRGLTDRSTSGNWTTGYNQFAGVLLFAKRADTRYEGILEVALNNLESFIGNRTNTASWKVRQDLHDNLPYRAVSAAGDIDALERICKIQSEELDKDVKQIKRRNIKYFANHSPVFYVDYISRNFSYLDARLLIPVFRSPSSKRQDALSQVLSEGNSLSLGAEATAQCVLAKHSDVLLTTGGSGVDVENISEEVQEVALDRAISLYACGRSQEAFALAERAISQGWVNTDYEDMSLRYTKFVSRLDRKLRLTYLSYLLNHIRNENNVYNQSIIYLDDGYMSNEVFKDKIGKENLNNRHLGFGDIIHSHSLANENNRIPDHVVNLANLLDPKKSVASSLFIDLLSSDIENFLETFKKFKINDRESAKLAVDAFLLSINLRESMIAAFIVEQICFKLKNSEDYDFDESIFCNLSLWAIKGILSIDSSSSSTTAETLVNSLNQRAQVTSGEISRRQVPEHEASIQSEESQSDGSATATGSRLSSTIIALIVIIVLIFALLLAAI